MDDVPNSIVITIVCSLFGSLFVYVKDCRSLDKRKGNFFVFLGAVCCVALIFYFFGYIRDLTAVLLIAGTIFGSVCSAAGFRDELTNEMKKTESVFKKKAKKERHHIESQHKNMRSSLDRHKAVVDDYIFRSDKFSTIEKKEIRDFLKGN